jgi:NAD(P)H-hydrate repair Nnr-like enzyme with NAD(P)H-hydrate dehydratase domain
LQKKKSDVILTPHLKELSRLCGCELFGAGQAAVRKLDVM